MIEAVIDAVLDQKLGLADHVPGGSAQPCCPVAASQKMCIEKSSSCQLKDAVHGSREQISRFAGIEA